MTKFTAGSSSAIGVCAKVGVKNEPSAAFIGRRRPKSYLVEFTGRGSEFCSRKVARKLSRKCAGYGAGAGDRQLGGSVLLGPIRYGDRRGGCGSFVREDLDSVEFFLQCGGGR